MTTATLFRSRTALSDDQIRRYAPSVFAEAAHAGRSDRYTYIPTSHVLAGLRDQGFEPFAVGQTRCRDVGQRDFTKHLLRFRQIGQGAIKVGDDLAELVLTNSHDGTSAYALTAGIYRLVCSNGMIVGSNAHEIKVRHSGNVVDEVIEGSFSVVESIRELVPVIAEWKGITLDSREREAFAEAAAGLRWDEGKAPVTATALLTPRRSEDHSPDLYTQFNVVQENLIRGGLRGRTTTNKRTTTRAVNSVNENVRLNKALWTLTAKLAEIKQGTAT